MKVLLFFICMILIGFNADASTSIDLSEMYSLRTGEAIDDAYTCNVPSIIDGEMFPGDC